MNIAMSLEQLDAGVLLFAYGDDFTKRMCTEFAEHMKTKWPDLKIEIHNVDGPCDACHSDHSKDILNG